MSNRQAFGDVVKKYRNLKGVSQETLAADTGLTRSYVGLLERGEYQPTLDTIFALSKALGIGIDVLMRDVAIRCQVYEDADQLSTLEADLDLPEVPDDDPITMYRSRLTELEAAADRIRIRIKAIEKKR